MAATRYWPRIAAVIMEIPANKSDPNSRLTSFFRSVNSRGEPAKSAANSGKSEVREA